MQRPVNKAYYSITVLGGLINLVYQAIYQIDCPNFVLYSIHIDPAFAAALNTDNQIYNKSFEKNFKSNHFICWIFFDNGIN